MSNYPIKKLLYAYFISLLLVLLLASTLSAQTQTLQEITNRIKNNEMRLQNFYCDYEHKQTSRMDGENTTIANESISTLKGKVRWRQYQAGGNFNEILYNDKGLYDSFTRMDKDGKPISQIAIVTGAPLSYISPLRFGMMVGNTWNSDVIKSSSIKRTGEVVDPVHGQLFEVVMVKSKDTEIRFSFAQKYDFYCVKTVIHNTDTKDNIIYQADEMKSYSGRWLPSKCSMKYFQASDPSIPKAEHALKIEKYEFDKLTDEDFNLILTPKSLIKEKSIISRVNADLSISEVHTLNRRDKNATSIWGGIFVVSVSSLLVLTVTAYVRWKRKQLSKSA